MILWLYDGMSSAHKQEHVLWSGVLSGNLERGPGLKLYKVSTQQFSEGFIYSIVTIYF